MSASTEYVEYIKELLSDFPELTVRKYFGGIALRSSALGIDTQFATILGDTLYFVVDDTTRINYSEKGMKPFCYEKKHNTVTINKWFSAPEELFENKELMFQWAMEALETAVRLNKK